LTLLTGRTSSERVQRTGLPSESALCFHRPCLSRCEPSTEADFNLGFSTRWLPLSLRGTTIPTSSSTCCNPSCSPACPSSSLLQQILDPRSHAFLTLPLLRLRDILTDMPAVPLQSDFLVPQLYGHGVEKDWPVVAWEHKSDSFVWRGGLTGVLWAGSESPLYSHLHQRPSICIDHRRLCLSYT
jgi:hypothetical protein